MKTPNTLQFPATLPVSCHTDAIGVGSTFVAIHGLKQDGIAFIPLALEKGATRIVVADEAHLPEHIIRSIAHHDATLLRVPDTRLALAQLSAEAHGYPAQSLKFVAITGTKGKTTTTFLVEHILRSAGLKTALTSTVKNSIMGVNFPTKLTTQQPDYLHAFFALCKKQGVEWVVLEVAAQAFSLHRVQGLMFDCAIFTNFSQEHGEFYQTLDDYFAAKTRIKEHMRLGAPLLYNANDTRVATFAQSYHYRVPYTTEHPYPCPQLIGSFNAYNIAAATQCAQLIKVPAQEIARALKSFHGVPGRLERYALPNGAVAFIDYAHNPASFEAVLGELRQHTKHLIVVFGAGGNRDTTKRPVMGRITSNVADAVILTTDNPRLEDPKTIMDNIVAGISTDNREKITIEFDREAAIKKAYTLSRSGSIIAILGKGPDEYQIIGATVHPFSERAILQALK